MTDHHDGQTIQSHGHPSYRQGSRYANKLFVSKECHCNRRKELVETIYFICQCNMSKENKLLLLLLLLLDGVL